MKIARTRKSILCSRLDRRCKFEALLRRLLWDALTKGMEMDFHPPTNQNLKDCSKALKPHPQSNVFRDFKLVITCPREKASLNICWQDGMCLYISQLFNFLLYRPAEKMNHGAKSRNLHRNPISWIADFNNRLFVSCHSNDEI